MKKALVIIAAVLSLNAVAASIPSETHTMNGASIFNESGILWDRGAAEYDAKEDGIWLTQYIQETNGSWMKNVWFSPCSEKRSILVRQVKGMWSRNTRVYDMVSARQFNGDTPGVTAFKAALCPAGKLKK